MKCSLPQGYVVRPVTMADSSQVVAMLNDWDMSVSGIAEFKEEDFTREWGVPGFGMERDTRVVISPEGKLVAYWETWDIDPPHVKVMSWGAVHPDYYGLGIGDYLLQWAEERGDLAVRMAPPEARVVLHAYIMNIDRQAQLRYERAGFNHIRSALRMVIDLDGPPPPVTWPEGVEVHTLRPGLDDEKTVQAVRDSFSDHWGYVAKPFENDLAEFRWRMENLPYFDPSLYFLAWDGEQVVGISLCFSYFDEDPDMGWVQTLGVCRPWRKQGLGMALLKHSFAVLYGRGKRRVGLGVDASSLTGATRLYEKAGMRRDPRREFKLYEKELRQGIELTTQAIAES